MGSVRATPEIKMILADFNLRPSKHSKFYTRIQIFDTCRNMEAAAIADGAMTGKAQACHVGYCNAEIKNGCIGAIYLYAQGNKTLRLDAIHELTHAAVHYVREIRRGDLAEPNNGEYASEAEELLCRTAEVYIGDFFERLAQFESSKKGCLPEQVIDGVLLKNQSRA